MSRVSVVKLIYHVNTDVVLDVQRRRSMQTGRLLLGMGRFYFFFTLTLKYVEFTKEDFFCLKRAEFSPYNDACFAKLPTLHQ